MSAWAYRYLDRLLSRQTIDRGFSWFWRHLKACDERFDLVVAASPSLGARLAEQGLRRVETIPMGVDPGIFSPGLRSEELRARLLAMCSLPPQATLLIGGSVIMEQIFVIPGMGLLLIEAVFDRDYPIVTGVFLVTGVAIVLINFLVDLSYGLLDPKVRLE